MSAPTVAKWARRRRLIHPGKRILARDIAHIDEAGVPSQGRPGLVSGTLAAFPLRVNGGRSLAQVGGGHDHDGAGGVVEHGL